MFALPRPRRLVILAALLCLAPMAPSAGAPLPAPSITGRATGAVLTRRANGTLYLRVAKGSVLPGQRAPRSAPQADVFSPATSNICPWRSQSGLQATDLNTAYWATSFIADPSVTYTITGTFPADRYTSFQAYTHLASDQSIGELLDMNFPPDAGSVNPLLAGTQRGTGTYTLHIVPGPVPTQTVSNTMYLNLPPDATISVWYRVYLPDSGATAQGNVPLPLLSAHHRVDGSGVTCPPALTPIPPGTPTMTPPLGSFIRYPIGEYPNHDNAYLATSLPVTSTLYVVRFQAPSTPHTLAGGIEDITTQLRYWSICVYGQQFVPLVCIPDEQVPQDQSGHVTIVMGPTSARPSNATAANGVQWIDLGTFTSPDIAVIRNLLPASDFAGSAFAVPFNQPAASYIGPYAPVMIQCGTAQFEADECSSIPTPTPPPTITPTGTPPPGFTPSPTPLPATISSSPFVLRPFQTLIITGTNYLAHETVKVFWESLTSAPSSLITTTTTDATGSFVAQARAPQDPNGPYNIAAVGQTDGSIGTASVSLRPLAVLWHRSGGAGAANALVGYGFGARDTVRAYWTPGGVPLGATSGVSATALGSFSGPSAITFTTPLSPTGAYTIVAIGQPSGAVAFSGYTINSGRKNGDE